MYSVHIQLLGALFFIILGTWMSIQHFWYTKKQNEYDISEAGVAAVFSFIAAFVLIVSASITAFHGPV